MVDASSKALLSAFGAFWSPQASPTAAAPSTSCFEGCPPSLERSLGSFGAVRSPRFFSPPALRVALPALPEAPGWARLQKRRTAAPPVTTAALRDGAPAPGTRGAQAPAARKRASSAAARSAGAQQAAAAPARAAGAAAFGARSAPKAARRA